MVLEAETLNFIKFIFIGIIFAIIFDFFRAYRKYKKVNKSFVILQDIIFLFIIFLITTITMIYFLDSEIRIYHFLAVIIGISIYIPILSKHIIKVYISFFKVSHSIFLFVLLPIKLIKEISTKILQKTRKFVKYGCNKSKYMVLNIYMKMKSLFKKIAPKKLKKTKVKRVKLKKTKEVS